jgi:hypothetical protein
MYENSAIVVRIMMNIDTPTPSATALHCSTGTFLPSIA